MRTVVTSKATELLAVALLLTCPFITAPANAMVVQRAVSVNAKSTSGGRDNPVSSRSTKATVLVKNTNSTVLSKPEPTAQKTHKVESKNTISRCWKRLMDNIREIRHTQRKK